MRENSRNGGRKRNCAPNQYNLHSAARETTKFADHVTNCANDAQGNKDISTRCAANGKSDLNHIQTSLSNKQAGEVSFYCFSPHEEASENTELTRLGDGVLRNMVH